MLDESRSAIFCQIKSKRSIICDETEIPKTIKHTFVVTCDIYSWPFDPCVLAILIYHIFPYS